MWISNGVGLTLGWKLKVLAGKLIPSQFATSLAFARGVERATILIFLSTSFCINLILLETTS
jgi:hypothetical protein